MNQLNIIGNIGSEGEIKEFDSGKKVARFSVAINGYSKDKEKKPATLWVTCELWDTAVDRLLKCQEKGKLTGRKVQVTGALANNHWKKRIGDHTIPMNTMYCKVRSFELLGGPKTDEPADDEIIEAPFVDQETGEVIAPVESTATAEVKKPAKSK